MTIFLAFIAGMGIAVGFLVMLIGGFVLMAWIVDLVARLFGQNL